MSKISLEVPFTAFKGKICKHTNIIYKQLRDTQFTSQICHPRTKAYSEEELARQAKFKTAAAAAKAGDRRARHGRDGRKRIRADALYDRRGAADPHVGGIALSGPFVCQAGQA